MTSAEERKRLNPLAAVLDAFGLPTPDEIVPPPGDVARMIGVPTPGDVAKEISGKIKGKVEGVRRF